MTITSVFDAIERSIRVARVIKATVDVLQAGLCKWGSATP
jgi:hypothetical protein